MDKHSERSNNYEKQNHPMSFHPSVFNKDIGYDFKRPLYSVIQWSKRLVRCLEAPMCITYPYSSFSKTSENYLVYNPKLILYYTNSTKSEKMPCSVNPTLPNILTSVLSFLVRLCVVYFVTPLNNPHILSPLL